MKTEIQKMTIRGLQNLKISYNSNAGKDTLYTHEIELTFKRYVISSIMRPSIWWLFLYYVIFREDKL